MKKPGISLSNLLLSVLAGCGGSGGEAPPPPPVNTTLSAADCSALASLQVPASQISLPTTGTANVTATPVDASAAGNPNVSYCKVLLAIKPVDASAQNIQVEINLPAQWNRKAVHFGGGGFDGQLETGLGSVALQASSIAPQLAQGYVTFGSDGGHQNQLNVNNDPSFFLNDEKLNNFAGDQLKKTYDVAMAFVKAAYGSLPTRMYFAGESEGGREGLIVAQRFGALYDGIYLDNPALAFTASAMKLNQMNRALHSNAGAGWMNTAKATLLQKATLAACDSLDGVSDGILARPELCRFDPIVLRCPGGTDAGDTCLSDAQLATVNALQTPLALNYSLANGWNVARAYHKGADLSSSTLLLGQGPSFAAPLSIPGIGGNSWFADGFVKDAIVRDPAFDSRTFDPATAAGYVSRVQALSNVLDATQPDLSALFGHGGRILLIHGLSDALLTPQDSVQYYQNVSARMGAQATSAAFRTFLIPGHAHNGTARAPVYPAQFIPAFDPLGTLVRWVEQGVAPDSIVVSDTLAATSGRKRLVCPYPQYAAYKGSGNVDDAASYQCRD